MPPLCWGRKKNRGYDPRWVREEKRGREEWRMTTSCVGKLSTHQAILRLRHMLICLLPSPSANRKSTSQNQRKISYLVFNGKLMIFTVLINSVNVSWEQQSMFPLLPFFEWLIQYNLKESPNYTHAQLHGLNALTWKIYIILKLYVTAPPKVNFNLKHSFPVKAASTKGTRLFWNVS